MDASVDAEPQGEGISVKAHPHGNLRKSNGPER